MTMHSFYLKSSPECGEYVLHFLKMVRICAPALNMQVKRVISWQVGNYYSVTSPPKSTWEGPRFKDGKLELWHTGANAERPFPIE